MKEKTTFLDYNGKQYPMIFTLNVMELIQEKYGSMDSWMDLIRTDEPCIKALKFGLGAMINEGIEIENEEETEKIENQGIDVEEAQANGTLLLKKFVEDKKIGRIVTELGISNVASKIGENIVASTKIDSSKNE